MAALDFIATTTPAAVPGLTEGTRYSLQNQSPDSAVLVATEAAAPSRGDPAFIMTTSGTPNDHGIAKMDPGELLYLWTLRGTSRVVYDTATT